MTNKQQVPGSPRGAQTTYTGALVIASPLGSTQVPGSPRGAQTTYTGALVIASPSQPGSV